jgi:hypothetical protein
MPEIRIETSQDHPSAGTGAGKMEGEGFDMWWEERTLGEKIGLGFLFAIGGILLLALAGWFVMLLWNWLMPDIFGLGTVDYWQAWGLLILSSILFKNIGGGSGGNGRSDRKRKKELRRHMQDLQEFAEKDGE